MNNKGKIHVFEIIIIALICVVALVIGGIVLMFNINQNKEKNEVAAVRPTKEVTSNHEKVTDEAGNQLIQVTDEEGTTYEVAIDASGNTVEAITNEDGQKIEIEIKTEQEDSQEGNLDENNAQSPTKNTDDGDKPTKENSSQDSTTENKTKEELTSTKEQNSNEDSAMKESVTKEQSTPIEDKTNKEQPTKTEDKTNKEQPTKTEEKTTKEQPTKTEEKTTKEIPTTTQEKTTKEETTSKSNPTSKEPTKDNTSCQNAKSGDWDQEILIDYDDIYASSSEPYEGTYNGEWKDGKPNGHGVFTYSGIYYSAAQKEYIKIIGNWKNGVLDGDATVIQVVHNSNESVNMNVTDYEGFDFTHIFVGNFANNVADGTFTEYIGSSTGTGSKNPKVKCKDGKISYPSFSIGMWDYSFTY